MALIRDISTANYAAMQKTFFPVVFVYIDWPSAPIRAHSNVGTITWGGEDWLGVGNLGSVEVPEEAGLVPESAVVSLLGRIEDILDAMGVDVSLLRNRDAEIFIGFTTTPGGAVLIDDPLSLFSGYVDTRNAPSQQGENGIQISMRLGLGSGPSARAAAKIVHSQESQDVDYPGDTIFRHLVHADSRRENRQVW